MVKRNQESGFTIDRYWPRTRISLFGIVFLNKVSNNPFTAVPDLFVWLIMIINANVELLKTENECDTIVFAFVNTFCFILRELLAT